MSVNENIVLAPVSITDVQRALGARSRDLGTLCTDGGINMFSKYKPNAIQGYAQPSDTIIETNRYCIKAIATNVRDNLYSMALGWTYDEADAPYYRLLDFNRYVIKKVIPFMQANGQRLVADLVNGTASVAKFYMLMNDGYVANLAFDADSGISRSVPAVDSGIIDYCICIEDLGFYGGGAYHSAMGGNLGLVIFNTSGTFKAEIFTGSGHTIRHADSRDNDMFILPLGSLTLPAGDYVAVACAKVTEDNQTWYLPVYDDTKYPAWSTLSLGGIDLYEQDRVGIAAGSGSASATPLTLLRTVDNDLYVTMRITNNSGRSLTLVVGNNPKFTLEAQVTGRVTDQTGTHDIGRTQVTANIVYPSSNLTIAANGGTGDIVFKITNVWSNSPTTHPTRIESGSITVVPTLKYNGTNAYPMDNLQPLISARYGTIS